MTPVIRLLDLVRDRAAVDDLFRRSADYVHLERGQGPTPALTDEFFTDTVPGGSLSDALKLGLFMGTDLQGIADVGFGYPETGDAYLGLMQFCRRLARAGPRFCIPARNRGSRPRPWGTPPLHGRPARQPARPRVLGTAWIHPRPCRPSRYPRAAQPSCRPHGEAAYLTRRGTEASATPPRTRAPASANLGVSVSPRNTIPNPAAITGTVSCAIAARAAPRPGRMLYQSA